MYPLPDPRHIALGTLAPVGVIGFFFWRELIEECTKTVDAAKIPSLPSDKGYSYFAPG